MISTLLSNRRALRAASVAVAGMALLSACDTDRSIGPVPHVAPDSASRSIVPIFLSGNLAISMVDWVGNPVKYLGTSFTLIVVGGADIQLQDNVAPDANSAIGGLLLQAIKPGTYTLCQKTAADHYVMVPYTQPCQSVQILAGKTTQLKVINYTTPRVQLRAMDTWNNPISTMHFTGNDANGQSHDIVDGGADDLDARPGYIQVEGPAGNYEVCTTVLPAGFVFPAGKTFGCTTQIIQAMSIAFFPETQLNHEVSIYWRLRLDGQVTWPSSAGTVSFEVKGNTPNGPFSMIVTDNGVNDLDGVDASRMGEFAAKLPAAGTYSVCQLNKAIGYQFPAQPCMRVTVSAGVPQLVGWFFNKKI